MYKWVQCVNPPRTGGIKLVKGLEHGITLRCYILEDRGMTICVPISYDETLSARRNM